MDSILLPNFPAAVSLYIATLEGKKAVILIKEAIHDDHLSHTFDLCDDQKLGLYIEKFWADGHAKLMDKLARQLDRDSVILGKAEPELLPMEEKLLKQYSLLHDDGSVPSNLRKVLKRKIMEKI